MSIYIGGPKTVIVSDMQGPCPDGFHVPLSTERAGLRNIMNSLTFQESYGVPWRIYLKMPYTGYRNSATTIYDQGSVGYYWTSNWYSSTYSYFCKFSNYDLTPTAARSDIGATSYTIRPFNNSFVVPTSTWTVLNGTLGSAGIFWNQTDGLISITSDGSTGYTIADKNLGATTVYNDGDTLSEANCGKYYQKGNNYGFPWTGTISKTSSTQVDASTYGPGNYYSSDTYITTNPWYSSYNDNLRGGVSQGTSTKTIPQEVKNIYIGEYVPPYEGDELCFTANTANSTVQLTKIGTPTDISLEISTDNINWSSYTIGDTITLSNIGDKVYFRNTSTTDTGFSTDGSNYYQFVMTGSIAGSGDITTLLNKNGTNTVSSYCFGLLFYKCSSLTTPPTLPATTLNTNCYRQMFTSCTSLSKAPELPATTLAESCYFRMFMGCSSLTRCPELPATTLARECYSSMFRGCTGLTTPPAILPATTLAMECYGYMFRLCTGLLTTPKLPATTLDNSCYKYMFQGCTGLLTISKLPATAMATECYNGMFKDCTNIKLSTSQTGAYQTAYRIPTTGTGSDSGTWYSLLDMFTSSGGTFTGTPTINTTYYTSNTIV